MKREGPRFAGGGATSPLPHEAPPIGFKETCINNPPARR